MSLFNVNLLSMFGGRCAITSITTVASHAFLGTSNRWLLVNDFVIVIVFELKFHCRMMIRMHLDTLVNYQATLSLPKARLVSLQNDAIRSGRVSLISCGCPCSVASVVTHADISRQNLYISGCTDGSLGVWDRSKKAVVRVQHTGVPIASLAAAPSGSFYAVGHSTGMLSFWNCKDLLEGKEASQQSALKPSTAVDDFSLQENSCFNITLTLLPGCPSINVSYFRVTLVGELAEVSASLSHSIDGSRAFQARVPLVFKIKSPVPLGPLSKLTLAVDSIVADLRSMFSHVTVSFLGDTRFTFKPQGEGPPVPVLSYFIADKAGSSTQDFTVHVFTGGDFGAGTDSKIAIIIRGVDGEVRLALNQSLTHADAFERGCHDVFFFSLPHADRVGEVCRIVMIVVAIYYFSSNSRHAHTSICLISHAHSPGT